MKRLRLTITINPELLPAVDQLIDRQEIRNRSQAIESLVEDGLGLRGRCQVVLITGPATLPSQVQTVLDQLQPLCPQTCYSLGQPFPDTEPLANHFGSGAALLLTKAIPNSVYLIIDLAYTLPSPLMEKVSAAYVQHKQNGPIITNLMQSSNGLELSYSGVTIASPTILSLIPAGKSDLFQDVFPLLAQSSKLGIYV